MYEKTNEMINNLKTIKLEKYSINKSAIHLKSRVTFVYFSSVLEGGVTSLVWNVPLNYSNPIRCLFLLRSKDGYQRSFILPSRVTFPTFPFSTDAVTHLHSLSLSLMLYRTLSWSHAGTYVHACRHWERQKASCIYAHAQTLSDVHAACKYWHALSGPSWLHRRAHCVWHLLLILLGFHVPEHFLTFLATARMWSIITFVWFQQKVMKIERQIPVTGLVSLVF